MDRPATWSPDGPNAAASSWPLAFGITVRVSGTTTTRATVTGETVTMAIPVTPSALAAMLTRPGVAAVTTPLPDTVAISVSALDQCMGTTPIGFPPASTAIARSVVWLWTSTPTEAGWISIAATGLLSVGPEQPPWAMAASPSAASVIAHRWMLR
jgi:hypothetical protein